MEEKTDNTQEITQYVSFVLSGEEYGVPIMKVQEIIRYEKLTYIPQSPDFIEGVLNLRGRVIPVIDLGKRFGLQEEKHDQSTKIIVVEIEKQVMGLMVDSVSEVRNILSIQIVPPPSVGTEIDIHYIQGMGKLDDQLIILLDLDYVLKSDEFNMLNQAVA